MKDRTANVAFGSLLAVNLLPLVLSIYVAGMTLVAFGAPRGVMAAILLVLSPFPIVLSMAGATHLKSQGKIEAALLLLCLVPLALVGLLWAAQS